MANALRALIQWYRTGDDADRAKYDIAWVRDKDSPVDTINGFIEVYLDPRGVKGAWEGLVFYVNQEKTDRIRKLADNAQWFEDRMPWDPKYRKPNVTGIIANAIDVVVETGDSGPVDARRHQPAQRPADPRAVRQQVGVAVERARGGRQRHAGVDAQRVLVDAGGGERARRSAGALAAELTHRHARGDRPRVGPPGRRPQRARRRR